LELQLASFLLLQKQPLSQKLTLVVLRSGQAMDEQAMGGQAMDE
jgi:hypothetical protein